MLRVFTAILIMSISMPIWAENACFSAPADVATLSEQLSQDVYNAAVASLELESGLLYKTDEVKEPHKKWTDIEAQLLKAKSQIVRHMHKLPGSEARQLMEFYFMATRGLAQSALHIYGAHNPFKAEYQMRLSRTNYLRMTPTVNDGIDGVSATLKADHVLLGHSSETKSNVHLEATARVQRVDREAQYFEASKCLLSRVFIQGLKGSASILNEHLKLDLKEAKACKGFKLQEMVADNTSLEFEEQRRRIRKSLEGGADFLTGEDFATLLKAREENGNIPLDFLFIQSAMGDKAEDMVDINERLTGAESKAFESNWFRQALSIGLETGEILKARLNSCGRNASLEKFAPIMQRLVAFKLKDVVSNSNLLAKTINIKDRKALLTESLVFAFAYFAEIAATAELANRGEVNALEAQYFFNRQAPAITEAVKRSVERSDLVAKLEKALDTEPEKKLYPILDGFKDLRKAAGEMHKHTSPYTLTSNLDFKPSAIAKLFDGEMGQLVGEYYFHADQIFTRSNHEERRKSWAAAQEFIQADMKKYGYKCESLGTMSHAGVVAKSFVGKGPSAKQTRQTSCANVKRYAEHLGLFSPEAPQKLGDVWASFEKHFGPDNFWINKEKEINRIEENYRKFLTIEWADVFPVMDIPLEKLNLDFETEWTKVYDIVHTHADDAKKEEVLLKALRFTMFNSELELMQILASQSLLDLHDPFISQSKVLNRLFGHKEWSNYTPGDLQVALGSKEIGTMYPSMMAYHMKYQGDLIGKSERTIQQRKDIVHKLTLPMIYMTGVWAVRGLMSYTPARGASAWLYKAGQDVAILSTGYFQALNWIFFAGLGQAYVWDKQLATNDKRLDELKLVDGIPDEDHQVLEYNTYYTNKMRIAADREQAQSDMLWYGVFTAFNVALHFAEPAFMTRGAMKVKKQKNISLAESNAKRVKQSWRIRKAWLASRLYSDKLQLRGALARLGLTKIPDISTLKEAVARSKHPNAQEAYYRIVSQIGQRASSNMGRADLEAQMAKSLFGNEKKVHELSRYSNELEKIVPDGVIGRLK